MRAFVRYENIGQRSHAERLGNGMQAVVKELGPQTDDGNIHAAIRWVLGFVGSQLQFSTDALSSNPDIVLQTGKAHCVGYAKLFVAIFESGKENWDLAEWRATVQIGKLKVAGMDVHTLFSSPFLKDHDYVRLENSRTKEIISVDPTLYDYAGIRYIRE